MLSTMQIAVAAATLTGCAQSPEQTGLEFATEIRCRDGVYEGFSYAVATAIPDGDPAGTRIGPIPIPDDETPIGELLVGVEISHGYVGDVELELLYDADADGADELRATLEIYQARLDVCDGEDLAAYPVVLEGRYFFGRSVREGPASTHSVLESFGNLERGGDFYLTVSDNADGSTGVVHGWSVYLRGDE